MNSPYNNSNLQNNPSIKIDNHKLYSSNAAVVVENLEQ